MGDPAIGLDEQHVERQVGIAHPHGEHRIAIVDEQHAGIRAHFATKHQAARFLLTADREFDIETMGPLGSLDDEFRTLKIDPFLRTRGAGPQTRHHKHQES